MWKKIEYATRNLSFLQLSAIMMLTFLGPPTFVASYLSLAKIHNTEEGVNAVLSQGYKDVQVLETSRYVAATFAGCGTDWKAITMHATSPSGMPVKIVTCEGMFFKGVTIRTL